MDLTVTAVRANPPVDIQVPAHVQQRSRAGEIRKSGGRGLVYHRRFSIQRPDRDERLFDRRRSAARRTALAGGHGGSEKASPNKPIKYLVNTHHHFDHASGVRAYAAEGVTIVTHEVNRPYFERAALNSWNLAPDRLAKSKKKPVFQTMGDNMVLTDGTRSVELYQIVGNVHHDGIIMAYLRKEKLLIEADVFTPAQRAPSRPKFPSPSAVNLEANVRRLNIDVDRIVPIHERSCLIASCSRHRQEAGAGEEIRRRGPWAVGSFVEWWSMKRLGLRNDALRSGATHIRSPLVRAQLPLMSNLL